MDTDVALRGQAAEARQGARVRHQELHLGSPTTEEHEPVTLYVDIETRSRRDLKKVGVYAYVEDPDFDIIMCAYAFDDDPVQTVFSQLDIHSILFDAWAGGHEIAAHNAQFERVCFAAAGFRLDPICFHDTMAIAGERGLPQSLDACAKAIGCSPKDSAGSKLIKLFCVPNRDGSWNDASTHPLEWLDFTAYCEQDVETLREIDKKMGRWPTEMERRVWVADQHINDRGMTVDLDMCRIASQAVQVNKTWQRAEMEMLTGIENPGSQPQMMRWAEEQNLGFFDFKADTIEARLQEDSLSPTQRRALEIRQEYALTSYGKFDTALITANDDARVRGAFNFFGAHTGRWSGRGVQLQNLPRQSFDNDADAALAVAELLQEGKADPQDLKRLVRAMFIGPLTVFDYSSIEARVIAWLAGERWALEAFNAGRDIYVETMKRMGLKSRFQGKVAVLALGYQGSVGSLRALMGTSAYYDPKTEAIVQAATLAEAKAAGYEQFIDDEVLLRMVRQWRKANSRIVNFWYDLQDALPSGGRVGQYINVRRRGSKMAIDLPSGRSIHYHGVRYDRASESWSYANSRYGRTGTYGGRLAENVTQAVARDVLAEALVRLDDAGYPVVAHIHDEVVIDGEFDLETVKQIMNHPPRWAGGLPINSEGFHCLRYRKN